MRMKRLGGEEGGASLSITSTRTSNWHGGVIVGTNDRQRSTLFGEGTGVRRASIWTGSAIPSQKLGSATVMRARSCARPIC